MSDDGLDQPVKVPILVKAPLVDADGIRKMFCCSRRYIRLWCKAGLIAPVAYKRKKALFSRDDVARVISADNDRYKRMLKYADRGDWEDRFTTSQVARMLGISRPTAERWANEWLQRGGQVRQVGAWAKLTRTQVRLMAEVRDIAVAWPTDEEMLLTVSEAADYLGVGRKRMWRMDRDETLIAAARTAKGQLRYTKAQVQRFAAKRREEFPFAVKAEVM